MERREFELQERRAKKFWTIEVIGSRYVATSRKVGDRVEKKQEKEFSSEVKAQSAALKAIEEKVRKGFVEVFIPRPTIKQKRKLEEWPTYFSFPDKREELPFDKEKSYGVLSEACSSMTIAFTESGARFQCIKNLLTLRAGMGREEALFWVRAVRDAGTELFALARRDRFERFLVDWEEIKNESDLPSNYLLDPLVIPFLYIFSPDLLATHLYDHLEQDQWVCRDLFEALLSFKIPSLPCTDLLSEEVERWLKDVTTLTKKRDSVKLKLATAILSGFEDEVFHLLFNSTFDDDTLHSLSGLPLFFSSKERVVEVFTKKRIQLSTEEELLHFLAVTREEGIPYLFDLVADDKPEWFWRSLLEVGSLELLPLLTKMSEEKVAPQTVRLWFVRDKERSRQALLQLAQLKPDSSSTFVACILKYELFDTLESLRELARSSGIDDQIEPFLKQYSEGYWLPYEALPEWWNVEASSRGNYSPPEWLPVDLLPEVRVGDRLLPPSLKLDLLHTMSTTDSKNEAPLVTACKANAREELARFAGAIFDRWSEARTPEEDRWVLACLPLPLSEDRINRLRLELWMWRRWGKPANAELALPLLAQTGLEEDLDLLREISSDNSSPKLQKLARELLSEAERLCKEQSPSSPRILLTTRDRSFINWTYHEGVHREDRGDFDYAKCMKEYQSERARLGYDQSGWYYFDVLRARSTKQEAHFWLLALSDPYNRFFSSLNPSDFDGSLSEDEAVKRLLDLHTLPSAVTLPLITLFTPLGALRVLEKVLRERKIDSISSLIKCFTGGVYGEDLDEKRLTALMHEMVSPLKRQRYLPISLYVAGHIGLQEELLSALRALPSNLLKNTSEAVLEEMQPELVLFALRDRNALKSEVDRLGMYFTKGSLARKWLALTEFEGLGVITRSILRAQSSERRQELFDALVLAEGPELTQQILVLLENVALPLGFEKWIVNRKELALPILLEALRRGGSVRSSALRYLTTPSFSELRDSTLESIKSDDLKSEVLAALETRSSALPEELTALFLTGKNSMINWININSLPDLKVDGVALDGTQRNRVITSLIDVAKGESPLLLSHLKQYTKDLPEFGWHVFSQWLLAGMPSDGKWALVSLGHTGDDSVAIRLTPLIKEWPAHGQFARAVTGLAVLREIGSDMALGQLAAIAEKSKSPALKKRARALLQEIAEERKLTPSQLEDRLIPTLGLDRSATRVLDYGSRRFTVHLDSTLKPFIRDESGTVKKDLPKPGTKDDAVLSEEARREWKLLKKSLSETAKNQSLRLEAAMVTGRQWKGEEFISLILEHPLLQLLAQRTLWRAAGKECYQIFRVSEDRELLDLNDTSVKIAADASVTIPHPLSLSEDERKGWSAVFTDYRIHELFPQLSREVLSLQESEREKKEINRYSGITIEAPSLVGTLERNGWRRGYVYDGGVYASHLKQFPGFNLTAMLEYENGIGFSLPDQDPQKLTSLTFFTGLHDTVESSFRSKAVEPEILGQVSPIVISEVLREVEELARKGLQ